MNAQSYDLLEFLEGYLGDAQFANLFASAIGEIKKKNADYSGKVDHIANFRNLAEDLGDPMRKIWLVYFVKGYDAIKRYCKDGQVSSEEIRSRIADAINYFVLLAAIVADEKGFERK